MSFHRNLNGNDLHAPSIFLIQYTGSSPVVPGDVLVVTGFNSVTRKFLVKLGSEIVTVTDPQIDYIFGIAKNTMFLNSTGSMDTFGLSLTAPILLTPNLGSTIDEPLAVGNFVFVPLKGSNKGVAVSGDIDGGIKVGLIVNIVSATSADILVLGLTAGIVTDNTGGTTNKVQVGFNTADFDEIGDEITETFNVGLGTIEFIAQWFRYYEDPDDPTNTLVEVIDVDWTIIDLNSFKVTLSNTLDRFEGYVEIVF